MSLDIIISELPLTQEELARVAKLKQVDDRLERFAGKLKIRALRKFPIKVGMTKDQAKKVESRQKSYISKITREYYDKHFPDNPHDERWSEVRYISKFTSNFQGNNYHVFFATALATIGYYHPRFCCPYKNGKYVGTIPSETQAIQVACEVVRQMLKKDYRVDPSVKRLTEITLNALKLHGEESQSENAIFSRETIAPVVNDLISRLYQVGILTTNRMPTTDPSLHIEVEAFPFSRPQYDFKYCLISVNPKILRLN